jgi:hypothetical protein
MIIAPTPIANQTRGFIGAVKSKRAMIKIANKIMVIRREKSISK